MRAAVDFYSMGCQAGQLGIKIPSDILMAADEVVLDSP